MTHRINLALQGGGSHGAFTWGVLDALLEDGRISLAGISGTSAGAINAVLVADGLKRGGADMALERFMPLGVVSDALASVSDGLLIYAGCRDNPFGL